MRAVEKVRQSVPLFLNYLTHMHLCDSNGFLCSVVRAVFFLLCVSGVVTVRFGWCVPHNKGRDNERLNKNRHRKKSIKTMQIRSECNYRRRSIWICLLHFWIAARIITYAIVITSIALLRPQRKGPRRTKCGWFISFSRKKICFLLLSLLQNSMSIFSCLASEHCYYVILIPLPFLRMIIIFNSFEESKWQMWRNAIQFHSKRLSVHATLRSTFLFVLSSSLLLLSYFLFAEHSCFCIYTSFHNRTPAVLNT